MGQRFIRFLSVFLLACLTACPLAAQETGSIDKEAWKAKLTLPASAFMDTYVVARDVVALEPEAGYAIVRDAWKEITRPDLKQNLMSLFVSNDHPHVLHILHLGATDPALGIQNIALNCVEFYALQNFTEDYSAYLEWYRQNGARPLADVLRDSWKAFAQKLATVPAEQRDALLNLLNRASFGVATMAKERRKAGQEAGLLDILARWLAPPLTPNSWLPLQIASNYHPDEAWLKRVIVPLLAKNNPDDTRQRGIQMLNRSDCRWAVDLLLPMVAEEYPGPLTNTVTQVLHSLGESRVVPILIGILQADDSREGAMVVGQMLGTITGIPSSELHDAAWWRKWWEKNRLRFAPAIADKPLPTIKIARKAMPPPQQQFVGGEPVIVIPRAVTRTIGNDPQKTYQLLIPGGAIQGVGFGGRRQFGGGFGGLPDRFEGLQLPLRQGADKPGLLVVLASDGDGPHMEKFWAEAIPKALHNGYMVALPVAPKWSEKQPSVWVTEAGRANVKEAKFSTESFLAAIVKDVTESFPIRTDRIFLHGVTESGPAVYTVSLEENTPFKGFYILASAFKSTQLPSLAKAKGRRYLIQHTQNDKVAPYWQATAAQKLLKEQGATAQLLPYAGDHGYNFEGDKWEAIGSALTWLENGK